MKLRSRPSSSSAKGKQSRQYHDSSDEDDLLYISSGSDYNVISDEDVADEADEVVNLTEEVVCSNRTKRNGGKKRIETKEDQGAEEEHVDWVMNEVGGVVK
ncbi:hypothetical protein RDI58_024653 [Solanum bulbocastanum]|uniref:Uncharacterized protein n=1 Tax=Solanum bulbocastanum TaxID=147425 RepID=A0AAN8SY22_SOLBU